MKKLNNKKIKEDLLNEVEIDKKFIGANILLMIFFLFLMLFLAKDILLLFVLTCLGIVYVIFSYILNIKKLKNKISKINTGEFDIKEFKLINKKEEYSKKQKSNTFILNFQEDINMYVNKDMYDKSKINDIFYIVFVNGVERPDLCYNKKVWNLIK